jgi:hypothetical protein
MGGYKRVEYFCKVGVIGMEVCGGMYAGLILET